ncbi:hypothetical protein [Pseudoxanthomonas sp. JBR18]|uniref:hypothetical protein n=1 Tax=Pseudoxanthomonas sp. JBR18 TaxID=2969308 RepID=UPI0023066581|nr:hypothetical protein [Pseudoxanthomonas sp. JBR18]WCE06537.1 hypothetical protein PJ250_09860 [Pseudoxanthomonas sp. JBR18]
MECIAQQLQVAQAVAVIEEARQPIVAPLHHMLRPAWQPNARKPRRGTSFAVAAR